MKIKRLLSLAGIGLIIFFGGICTLLLFPQPLFSHSYTHENFRIFSSSEINSSSLYKSIDQAREVVSLSELHDPNYHFDLFLADQTFYNRLDSRVLGDWPVARATHNNITIKQAVDLVTGTVANGNREFDLVYVLVHEMIHCLQQNKYGIRTFNPLKHPPMWKLEGYPEYMGRQIPLQNGSYDLRADIQLFLSLTQENPDPRQILQTGPKASTPYIYYKGKLMTTYLIEMKGWSYDQILDPSVQEKAVFEEMMKWYRQ